MKAMPKELKETWVKALRGGKYEQTQEYLCNRYEQSGKVGYCCLGVLYREVVGRNPPSGQKLPSIRFAKNLGIEIEGKDDDMGKWSPYVDGKMLAEINDSGCDFEEIANLIQKNVEGV